ncbi:hypothetical protein RIF29_18761 [Crotalaria pallida]|uniref:Uncharacterized protein n=1 Tax=Crotalaria pallida TaxID=3830 RepID=A0AAN9EZH0_CROPI
MISQTSIIKRRPKLQRHLYDTSLAVQRYLNNSNINMEGDGKHDHMKGPKIQCVSRYLRGMGFETFYTPQIISFGPFHLNEQSVGQTYKTLWTAMYLKETNQKYEDVLGRINGLCDELRQSYLDDDIAERDLEAAFAVRFHPIMHDEIMENYFTWMWLVDGCSILHVLDKSYNSNDPEQELNVPEQELNVSIDRLARVHKDMLLLENQIPFKLLKIICNDEAKLNVCLQNFLENHGVVVTSTRTSTAGEVSKDHLIVKIGEDEGDPIHLLDYLHRGFLMKSDHGILKLNKKSLHLRKYRVGSIQELKKAGIRIQKLPDGRFVHPIFNSNRGILQLPDLIVNDSTAVMFLNLIAYEMCPDFRNDFDFSVSSFIVFFSSLIDKPEDVKELRSCGVLINELAGDKEVVDLFNQMDALLVPETNIYAEITYQMQKYFVLNPTKIKMLGWLEEAYSSFLHSPWTIIALLAATLGLTLTFIQTWFAIHPKDP